MRSALTVLCLTLSCASAFADDLIWKSPSPTGRTLVGPMMTPGSNCYATIRRSRGVDYYHPMQCAEKVRNHLDIGVPLNRPMLNMGGVHEARTVRILKNGWIDLR